MDILKLCNIDSTPIPKKPTRVKATLSFEGAENYVLGTKDVVIDVHSSCEGFRMQFLDPVDIEASTFLGSKIRTCVIHDVRVDFEGPMPGLSMAKLHPGIYPHVLRDHETLRVHGS